VRVDQSLQQRGAGSRASHDKDVGVMA
jgi:hypothetical protein